MAGHKSAIGGIWFEMKAWMRFLLPSRYLAAYYPTPDHIVQRMLKVAEVTAADTVYDLGCGDGRMLTTAAAQRGCRGVGVELNAELAAMAAANVRQRGLSHLVTIRQGDATQADVRDATVLMLYLSEKGNVRILKGVEPSLQPGTRVVSYFWTIPDAAWEKRLTAVDTTDKLPIYLYRYDCGGGGAMRTAAETATASSSSAGSSFGGADTLPAVQESVVAAVRAAADKQETPRPNHLLFPLAGT